jgi:hypothetical protein
VILWGPGLIEILRFVKVAAPSIVVTVFVPVSSPSPENFVAVIVKLSAVLFTAVIALDKLSCTVTTGGGLKATALNLSIGLLVGTSVKAILLATP